MPHLLDNLRDETADRRQLFRRFALRAATIGLVLLALVTPSCEQGGGEEQLAVLVDLSGSVALGAVGTALGVLEQAPSDHVLGFADRAVRTPHVAGLRGLELLDRSASGLRRSQASNRAIVRDDTNLERALRSGLDLLPTDGSGRILLLTDGNPTEGNIEAATRLAQQRRVRVDTVPLAPAKQPPRITAVTLPARLSVGPQHQALVSVASTEAAQMLLEVRAGEGDLQRLSVTHPGSAGEDSDLLVEVDLRFHQEGDQPLSLRLVPAGEDSLVSTGAPSRWRSTVRVEAKPKVLLVEGNTPTPLRRALEARGLDLRRVRAEAATSTLAGLAGTDVLLLHDVDANDLGSRRMQAINTWVKAGGSLVFASGESSYGEGGYNDTPIADILPVTFEVREEKAEVALMISLDKSYSMKGDKMDLAKEATKAALGELEDEHMFGLVAFDWNTFNIVPLQLASNRDDIRDQISKIEASAQTNFYPALESCFRQLSAIPDPDGKIVKHVILVSDGKTYPDDYEGLVRRMYDADITLSTVAVGLESDVELLQQIAEWGHGRSYFVQDAARVQKILLDEARSKLEDTLVEEDTKVSARNSHPALRGIDIATAPALKGYVAYRAKGGTEVVLETTDEQPILARRRIGSGEAWVLATDLTDRWSAPWLSWSGFVPMVSQILHSAASGTFSDNQRFSIERRGHELSLEAELHGSSTARAPGAPLNGARVEVNIGGASAQQTIPLLQGAPGEYRAAAQLEPDPSGDIRLELLVNGQAIALRSLYYPGTDELDPAPANTRLLQDTATTTGGIAWTGDDLAQALARRPQEVRRTVELWRWFLAAAALLYLLELVLHRLGKLDRPFDQTLS